VIAVGSIAHKYSKIREDDIEFESVKKSSLVYGNSKRFFMFSLFKLFENETETTLSVCHPGVTLTNMTNHYHKSINWLVKIGIKLLFPSPQKATLHLLNSMFVDANYLEFIGPTIFGVWGQTKNKKLTKMRVKRLFYSHFLL
jgi:hypothetical protein